MTTSWRESEAGPPRRYYRINDDGRRVLDAFIADWSSFRSAVDALLAARIDGEVQHGH